MRHPPGPNVLAAQAESRPGRCWICDDPIVPEYRRVWGRYWKSVINKNRKTCSKEDCQRELSLLWLRDRNIRKREARRGA